MITRLLLAGLHLLGLGIGLGAVWARGRALTSRLDAGGLRSVFLADNFWGLAAGLWLATGLWRGESSLTLVPHHCLPASASRRPE